MKLIAKHDSSDGLLRDNDYFLQNIYATTSHYQRIVLSDFFGDVVYLYTHPDKKEQLLYFTTLEKEGWNAYLFSCEDRLKLFQKYTELRKIDLYGVEKIEQLYQKERLRSLFQKNNPKKRGNCSKRRALYGFKKHCIPKCKK